VGTEFTLAELADAVGGRVLGDDGRLVVRVATLADADVDALSFLTNRKYRNDATTSAAGAFLVGEDAVSGNTPDPALAGRDLVVAPSPYLALAKILAKFHPQSRPTPGVDPDARVGADVEIGERVHVGPYSVIEAGCRLADDVVVSAGCYVGHQSAIGERTMIHPRVVLYSGTSVGADCILHAGVVLGADGFGFAQADGRHHKIPQVGTVVVEDDVEIGANSAVDRGAIGETRIGAGSKLDDLVMIAHGVKTGRGGLFVGQSGVAGSSVIGDHVTVAGQSGVAGHLTIGDRVVIAAKSAVFSDIDPDSFVAGVPAIDHREWKRIHASSRRLGEMRGEIKELRRQIEELQRRSES